MKALIQIYDEALAREVRASFDEFVANAGDYYEQPYGTRSVVPAHGITADKHGYQKCGISTDGYWNVWTRSSGTVAAVTYDGRRLLVAGTRHSIAEFLFNLGSYDPEQKVWRQAGKAVAGVEWMQSSRPDVDPLRPTM